jgi:hypothetical protein
MWVLSCSVGTYIYKLEDTKGVFSSRNLKKDSQHIGKRKKDSQHIGKRKKDEKTMVDKILHRKLNRATRAPLEKDVNSGAPKG